MGKAGTRQLRIRIGKTIRRIRMERGKSIDECAEACAVDRWRWMRWEGGAAVPLEYLPAMTKVLEAPVTDLYPPTHQPVLQAAA